jgi:hypothetical protein
MSILLGMEHDHPVAGKQAFDGGDRFMLETGTDAVRCIADRWNL